MIQASRAWPILAPTVALGAGVLLSGCVAAILGSAPQSGTPADARARGPGIEASGPAALSSAVQRRLAAESALAGTDVVVSAQGGHVTLSGTVQNPAQRALAGRVTRAVNGVSAVNNQIEVQ